MVCGLPSGGGLQSKPLMNKLSKLSAISTAIFLAAFTSDVLNETSISLFKRMFLRSKGTTLRKWNIPFLHERYGKVFKMYHPMYQMF